MGMNMQQFVLGVDPLSYITPENIQTIFECHCPEEEFDVIKIPHKNLPNFRKKDLGGFLDSRYAYAHVLLQRYPARYGIVATSATMRSASKVRIVHFAVASDRSGCLRRYVVLNPNLNEVVGEALANLATLVLINLIHKY